MSYELKLSWLSSFEKEEGTAACGGEVVRFSKYYNKKYKESNHLPLVPRGTPPFQRRRAQIASTHNS